MRKFTSLLSVIAITSLMGVTAQAQSLSVAAQSDASQEVVKEPVNIALGKPARQSSNYMNNGIADASKAVDGNTDSYFKFDNSNSITHTKDELSPWWEVDLGEVVNIDKIVIWNRLDPCCWDRSKHMLVTMSDKEIEVTDYGYPLGPVNPWSDEPGSRKPSETIYEVWTSDLASYTLEVYGMVRYVRITLFNDEYQENYGELAPLSLAEVQIFKVED